MMSTLHRYPPAKDNPGRVSAGEAKDMEKRAILAREGISHDVVIDYLRTQRSTKKQRKARAGKKKV